MDRNTVISEVRSLNSSKQSWINRVVVPQSSYSGAVGEVQGTSLKMTMLVAQDTGF